jgi:two-component system sensor histidine kinase HydH
MAKRAKSLSLPALALVIAILATSLLLLFTTLRSLDREQKRMARDLEIQGTAIIRTLESSARAGMMHRWGKEQLQALTEEASAIPGIAYVGIFDSDGAVIADHGRNGLATPLPGITQIGELVRLDHPVFSTTEIGGEKVFQVAKRFSPHGRRRLMGRMGRLRGPIIEGDQGERWVIILGLYTGPWEKVLAESRRQILLSFLVILIAGSLALYLGILLQNNFVVRRTLDEMRAYAQNILENMADGLISVDGKGKIATFNTEAARLLQGEGSDFRGRDLYRLLPGATGALDMSLEGRSEREELEITLPGAGGEGRPAGVSISPLRDEERGITGAVLLLRDLTEVRRLQTKIRDAEKLAALGQMAATVAHEIRNPLSSLKGFAQLFEGKFEEGSREAEYARLMVREVDRLNRTVTDLLFYSRQVKLTRREIALDALLEKTIKLLGPDLTARKQKVVLETAGDAVTEADPDQISQVFLNILLNAHQAAGEGGKITVRSFADDGWCRVEFSDNGPGMDPEQVARAFEPFFTTREKGSGLGLAIVKKIVDLHEGGVAITSAPGDGTTVTVKLRRRKEKDGGREEA